MYHFSKNNIKTTKNKTNRTLSDFIKQNFTFDYRRIYILQLGNVQPPIGERTVHKCRT